MMAIESGPLIEPSCQESYPISISWISVGYSNQRVLRRASYAQRPKLSTLCRAPHATAAIQLQVSFHELPCATHAVPPMYSLSELRTKPKLTYKGNIFYNLESISNGMIRIGYRTLIRLLHPLPWSGQRRPHFRCQLLPVPN